MARKAVTVNFEITNQSFRKLDEIMKKFKLDWDGKVLKSTDKLGKNLYNLERKIQALINTMVKQRYAKAQGTGTATGAGVQFDMDEFFDRFGKEMNRVTDNMAEAADAISKLTINVKGNTSASGEEGEQRRADYASMELAEGQRKIMQQKMRDDNRKVAMAMDHRLKQERLMTRHMMSMFGGGLVSGQLGLLIKEVGTSIGKKFTGATAASEYANTEEGQRVLKFQKAAEGSRNPLGGFGEQISKDWQEKGVTTGGLLKAGSASGRAKSWMGRRIEGAQTGDMGKLFGGKKGMMMAGGALMGVGIMKKAISLGIESSPMMQQMLKLWKFGIMMIFRPIGDFFGFFLRPIFVMLLRKFIIPFYQEYLPMMQKMGHDLGEKVAGFLISILEVLGGTKGEDRFVTVSAMAGKGEDYAKFSEPLSLAMTESMIQNASYWEKMFIEMGKVPEWVKTSLPNNPELWAKWEDVIDDVAKSSNTNVTGVFGTSPAGEAATEAKTAWDDFWDYVVASITGGNPNANDGKGYNEQTGYVGVDPSTVPTWLGGTATTAGASGNTNTLNISPITNINVNADNMDDMITKMTNIAEDGDANTKKWAEDWLSRMVVQ